MGKKDLVLLGSNTAKAGFRNEDDIIEKFKNWEIDTDSQEWLVIMGYDLKEIEKVDAIKLHGYKTDVQVKITIFLKDIISAENLTIKLVSNPRGFNQIDKRKIDKYSEMWNIPISISNSIKLFTGEIKPNNKNTKYKKRMLLTELPENDKQEIVDFFTNKKILVVSDIIKGRGQYSAGWMLVALKLNNDVKWVLKSINYAMQVFGNGSVEISKRGSLKIGNITMQRKGGDGGRDSAKMLQFKVNPVLLFN